MTESCFTMVLVCLNLSSPTMIHHVVPGGHLPMPILLTRADGATIADDIRLESRCREPPRPKGDSESHPERACTTHPPF